jgi:hypothetical protein
LQKQATTQSWQMLRQSLGSSSSFPPRFKARSLVERGLGGLRVAPEPELRHSEREPRTNHALSNPQPIVRPLIVRVAAKVMRQRLFFVQ